MNTTNHATNHAIDATLAATGIKATYTGAGMTIGGGRWRANWTRPRNFHR